MGLREMVEEVLGRAGGLPRHPPPTSSHWKRARPTTSASSPASTSEPPPSATPSPPSPIPSPSRTRPGPLLIDKATALGVVGAQAKELKDGKSVVTRMGIVQPQDVLGPSLPPFSVALVQDSGDCRDAYAMLQGVDVLVHECTYEAGMEEMASERGHSTAAQAGRVAREVNARALIPHTLLRALLPGREELEGVETPPDRHAEREWREGGGGEEESGGDGGRR